MLHRHNCTAIVVDRDEANALVSALVGAVEHATAAIEAACLTVTTTPEERTTRDALITRLCGDRSRLHSLMIAMGA
jgi:hypothetical protein